jgi:hypothetical protein
MCVVQLCSSLGFCAKACYDPKQQLALNAEYQILRTFHCVYVLTTDIDIVMPVMAEFSVAPHLEGSSDLSFLSDLDFWVDPDTSGIS